MWQTFNTCLFKSGHDIEICGFNPEIKMSGISQQINYIDATTLGCKARYHISPSGGYIPITLFSKQFGS